MVKVTEVRPGNTYIWEGQLYSCLSIDLNKTAMAKMKVKLKSKNLRTGAILDMSFIGSDNVEIVRTEKKKMGYLYDDGTDIVFMDNETYEQISIDKAKLEWEMNFLKDGIIVDIIQYEGEILGIQLPSKVTLQLTQCDPATRGDTVKAALKDAVCETGLKVKVPLFIEQDDYIVVSTETGAYDSRA